MVGAGTIGVAAIWTLLRIIGPIIAGIRSALAANRERKAGRAADLPITEARHSDRDRHRRHPVVDDPIGSCCSRSAIPLRSRANRS
jgi:hypothetical protein